MTFEQFQATKLREPRAVYCAKMGFDEEFVSASHVLTYHDGTAYIEDDEGSGYYLILGRSEFQNADLAKLERLLFDWCISEAYFEETK